MLFFTHLLKVLPLVKQWILPLALCLGAGGFFFFHYCPQVYSLKPFALQIIQFGMPYLIFLMLFFAFCKIKPQDLGWAYLAKKHKAKKFGKLTLTPTMKLFLILLCLQTLLVCIAIFFLGMCVKDISLEVFGESVLICCLAPTATASTVVVAKLKGNTALTTMYTLINHFWVVGLIFLLFPFLPFIVALEGQALLHKIGAESFRLLILPLVSVWLLRYLFPKVYAFLAGYSHLAFYLWAMALVIVMAQTTRFIFYAFSNSIDGCKQVIGITLLSLAVCVLQFYIGRYIGNKFNLKITIGQCFGQKNTIFATWLAYTYFHPMAAIGAGLYVVWQNCFNAYQIHRFKPS